jgi:prolyl oligopeptidase
MSTRPDTPVKANLPNVSELDPYRWLEDRSSERTDAWIASQKAKSDTYFSTTAGIDALRQRVAAYLSIPMIDQPGRVGPRHFYRRRAQDHEQASICVNTRGMDSERSLVDPSTIEMFPFVSLRIHAVSNDGKRLAYQVRHGGAQSSTIHIVDVDTSAQIGNLPKGKARGLVFADDMLGFYSCDDLGEDAERFHTIQLRLFATPNEAQTVLRKVRSKGSQLVLIGSNEQIGAVHYHDLDNRRVVDFYVASQADPLNWTPIACDAPPSFTPLLYQNRIFALTYSGAVNGKVVELSPDGRERAVIIPETDSEIQQLCLTSGRIFASYITDLQPNLCEWTLEGQLVGNVPVPRDSTITLCGPLSTQSEELFYVSESFSQAPTIKCYLPQTRLNRTWAKQCSPLERGQIAQRTERYRSKDGTEISILLVSLAEHQCESERPTIMTAYGGFGACMTPRFSVLVSILLELGFRFALPIIRGGGERGPAWHESAKRRYRHRAVEDFIGAAEFLIGQGCTSPSKLAIFGGSHSGLLVATAMTQRPDLFRAVLCIAPLTDMLRYHTFDGAARWTEQYGTADNLEDSPGLLSYSPYHQIQEDIDYPATLFVSGDQDTKCNPAHARKMAARLQHRSAQNNSILLDYTPERGHSPTLPLSVRIEALTKRIAFLCRELTISIPMEWPHGETRS